MRAAPPPASATATCWVPAIYPESEVANATTGEAHLPVHTGTLSQIIKDQEFWIFLLAQIRSSA
jgi:hypothetical protein